MTALKLIGILWSETSPASYDFGLGHPSYLDVTVAALEAKWRPRASLGIPDHAVKDLVPAGFLEVRP